MQASLESRCNQFMNVPFSSKETTTLKTARPLHGFFGLLRKEEAAVILSSEKQKNSFLTFYDADTQDYILGRFWAPNQIEFNTLENVSGDLTACRSCGWKPLSASSYFFRRMKKDNAPRDKGLVYESDGQIRSIIESAILQQPFFENFANNPSEESKQGYFPCVLVTDKKIDYLVMISDGKIKIIRDQKIVIAYGNKKTCHKFVNLRKGKSITLASFSDIEAVKEEKKKLKVVRRECKEFNKGLQRQFHRIFSYPLGGSYFYLTHYYPTDLINTLLDRDKEKVLRMLKGFQSIIELLAYCHKLGIAHNDVKADNVLVEGDVHTLIDWEYVALESQKLWEFSTGCKGSYFYLTEHDSDLIVRKRILQDLNIQGRFFSPQEVDQIKKETISRMKQKDVFGVGVTLFAICTGLFPYNKGKGLFPDISRPWNKSRLEIELERHGFSPSAIDTVSNLLDQMLKPIPSERISMSEVQKIYGSILSDLEGEITEDEKKK